MDVRIRPIRPEDKALLSWGLANLSEASVQRRFLSPKPCFTVGELRYLTEVDGHDHVALIAEDESGSLLAVGRFVRLAEDAAAAELAIAVADPFQGRGVGTLLGQRLADEAARQGVHRFTATMLSENRAAHALMAKLAGRLERRLSGRGTSEVSANLAA
ncbi:MAG: GNAT family N-acetyltransferase [Thermoleophilaceae bacterium]|nr:GNAT family N-acetyltransferase [Thermoleophilaceae bacterium]